jgi:hypothetical protein
MQEMLDQRPQETDQDKKDADDRKRKAQRQQGRGKDHANEAKQEVHAHATVQEENQGDSGDGNDAMGAKEEEERKEDDTAAAGNVQDMTPAATSAVGYFENALKQCGLRDDKNRIKDLGAVIEFLQNENYPEDLMEKLKELSGISGDEQVKQLIGPDARQALISGYEELREIQKKGERMRALQKAVEDIEKEKERLRLEAIRIQKIKEAAERARQEQIRQTKLRVAEEKEAARQADLQAARVRQEEEVRRMGNYCAVCKSSSCGYPAREYFYM